MRWPLRCTFRSSLSATHNGGRRVGEGGGEGGGRGKEGVGEVEREGEGGRDEVKELGKDGWRDGEGMEKWGG